MSLLSFLLMMLFPSESPAAPETGVELTELSLEELMEVRITTASKYEQSSREAPSSVTVITADEIKRYGHRTLAEVLRSVRGFFFTYDRNYTYLGMRGFGRPGDFNTRFLLLVDGHRVNDNIYGQAAVGTEFILDIDLIDRIEIVRGPSSSLYGEGAFFGVINVLTRKGRDLSTLEASGDAGSLKTYKGRLTYGNSFQSGPELLISGTVYDSDGERRLYFKEFDDPAFNNGVAVNSDDDHFGSTFGKLTYKDFTLEGAYVKRRKKIPTGSYETFFGDPRNETVDERWFLDLKYAHRFEGDLDVTARVSYDRYYYHGDYVYDWAEEGDPPDLIVNRDYARGAWWGAELQFSRKFFKTHRLIWGAEYRNHFRQDQGNHDLEVYLNDKRDSTNWALYLQDEVQIAKNVLLNAGVRYDHFDTFGETVNPRLGLLYYPFEKTALKALYGRAFRAPNAYEFYYNDLEGPATIKPNPDLDPETINTYEMILEQGIGRNLKGTIVAFFYATKDLINQVVDDDGLFVFRNLDEVEARGLEFELEGRWADGLQGRISYTYQESEDKQTNETLTNSPRHLAGANVIVPLLRDKVFLGVEERYMSSRKTVKGTTADDFFVTNVTLFGKNLIRGLEISVSVYDVFDEQYGDPASNEHEQDLIRQDGRAFRVKLTYTF